MHPTTATLVRYGKLIEVAGEFCRYAVVMWPFGKRTKKPEEPIPRTKVVVEIPDALVPADADRKYVEPLRRLLTAKGVGSIVGVSQGAAHTADEFTRFIAIELTSELEVALDLVCEFLAERGAPPGTFMHVHDNNGNVVDHFVLVP